MATLPDSRSLDFGLRPYITTHLHLGWLVYQSLVQFTLLYLIIVHCVNQIGSQLLFEAAFQGKHLIQ